MTPEQREAFVVRPLPATLGTVDARGRAHVVPVIYLYEGDEFLVITARGSQKVKNAIAAGRATLCIEEREKMRYLSAEGPVRVVDPVSYETRLRLHTHYRGAEAALKSTSDGGHERMVALMITPERWY
ncbi:MAG: pyridoxamine 5'-phosphate oxidase family protein [bacterium]